MTPRIAVLDDEARLVAILEMVLRRSGYEVEGFSTPDSALNAHRSESGEPDDGRLDAAHPAHHALKAGAGDGRFSACQPRRIQRENHRCQVVGHPGRDRCRWVVRHVRADRQEDVSSRRAMLRDQCPQ